MDKAYIGSINVKVKTPDFNFKNREMLRAFKRKMRIAHTEALGESREILKRHIRDVDAVDTGKLLNSVASKLFVKNDEIFQGTVHFNAPGKEYAHFVDKGRGKGFMPPKAKFTAWAKRHGINNPRLIFYLRLRIAKRGTKGKKFMAPATREINRSYNKIINTAVNEFRRSIK